MMQGNVNDSKQKAWLEHYQKLLNAEFDWDPNHLSDESPISQMKASKAQGPSGIVVEMFRAGG